MNTQRLQEAFEQGQEAVRRKPHRAPQNPYDTDGYLREAWDEGAESAGINDIYHNGELTPSEPCN